MTHARTPRTGGARRIGAATAVVLTSLAGLTTVATPAAQAAPVVRAAPRPVCAGVTGCRVVTHVDVDGDGRRDTVAVVRRGAPRSADGRVEVRVRTATALVTTRRTLSFWFGRPWRGATRLDGAPGAELVVGATSGAHTLFEHVLTWRHGRLVTLRTPGGDATWVVDGTVNFQVGWRRPPGAPAGTLTGLTAERNGNGSGRTFTGTATRWRWSGGRWVRGSGSTDRRLPERTAYGWGGWHAPPLPRF